MTLREPGGAGEGVTQPWLPGQLTRVDQIQALPENWDSHQAMPVSPVAAEVARALLHLLSAWQTVAPRIRPQLCPTPEGGVQFEWHEQGYNLEVEIEPDGRICGWLHRRADGAAVNWPPETDQPAGPGAVEGSR